MFLNAETRATLLWGAEPRDGAALGNENWFFQLQFLQVNSFPCDERAAQLAPKGISHTRVYDTLCALDAILMPLW